MHDIDSISTSQYANVSLIYNVFHSFWNSLFRMTEQKHKRFEEAFSAPSVQMVEIQGNIFVLLNSMALEGDGCNLCSEAVSKLEKIFLQLKCSRVRNNNCDLSSYLSKVNMLCYKGMPCCVLSSL